MTYTDCQPDGRIPSNPDIAGPGVIAAFVIPAWITILASIIAMLHSWHRVYKTSPFLVHLSRGAESLLGPLCDLQVLTGGAILAAGFSQWHTITFYHREMISAYWWLISNSFWSSRSVYMYNALKNLDSSWHKWRIYVRRSMIVINVAMGIFFFSASLLLENREWDDEDPERCYNFNEPTYEEGMDWFGWFWIAGLCMYELTLLISFVDSDARLERLYSHSFQAMLDLFRTSAIDHYGKALEPSLNPGYGELASYLRYYPVCVVLWLLFLSFWVLRQLLSVWTYGEGRNIFFCIFYYLIGGWNTYDVFMLKVMNAHLVAEGETNMGFGQILPLFIMLQIPLSILDVWKNPKMEKERRFLPLDRWGSSDIRKE